jgi:2-polyprenyl-6-hydroxyphenyl methylase/3-demethylubiquinone-9 3-methyltransferase
LGTIAHQKTEVNNSFYELYGERWYTAFDDPVALLRAESKVKIPWVLQKILKNFYIEGRQIEIPNKDTLLDVGCGAGFLANAFSKMGFQVTGIDMSENSLQVAHAHDFTGNVNYIKADAYSLPFPDSSFDYVTAMDFLEHVDKPEIVIREISRVLKPKGLFFYHTFNRNILAYFVIIKFVEWFIRNTPKNMHIIDLFIKPTELKNFCEKYNLKNMETVGIRPVLSSMPVKNYFSGIVAEGFKFKIISSTALSYMGYAKKANQ